MNIYFNLLKDHESPLEHWPVYADVTCRDCKKVQSLANYRSNGSQCIKCGEKIEV